MTDELIYSPEYTRVSSGTGMGDLSGVGAALSMDPADIFGYLQQNRQRMGLSDQFQAYNEGDNFVLRMSRDDVQHIMQSIYSLAGTYMQMSQRNPQLLSSMNTQSPFRGPGDGNPCDSSCGSGCACGGGCQCSGGSSFNRFSSSPSYTDTSSTGTPWFTDTSTPQYTDTSTPQYTDTSTPQYTDTSTPQYIEPSTPQYIEPSTPQYIEPSTPQYIDTSTPQYTYPANQGYPPNYGRFSGNGGYNGYNGYNGFGGNPLMGNPGQALQYMAPAIVSGLINRSIGGGGRRH